MVLKTILAGTLAFWLLVRLFDRENRAANVAALGALFLIVAGYVAIDVIDFAAFIADERRAASAEISALDDVFAND